jgi:hypothetical protein
MGCWPPPSQQLESEISPSRNPQSDSVYDDHALDLIARDGSHCPGSRISVRGAAKPSRDDRVASDHGASAAPTPIRREAGQRVVARRSGQTIDIDEATGVSRLLIRLDDSMADLDKPVTVRVLGKVAFEGIAQRSFETIRRTLDERVDPSGAFFAEIEIAIDPEPMADSKP